MVRTLPHDRQAYTEGLVVSHGFLFESTGQRGSGSSVRKIDLASGTVLKRVNLRRSVFAEGLAELDGRLYQLTWQQRTVMTYDSDLNRLGDLRYPGEAWGLTRAGTRLILSDGTNVLSVIDPRTFAVVKTVRVLDHGRPVDGLNELEWVGAEVFANVFGDRRIARIDLASGRVRSWLDLTALVDAVGATDEDAVLNGIAFDPGSGHLYVTGKLWPRIFEIELTAPRRPPGRT